MIVNDFTRNALESRRFEKKMSNAGYRRCEPEWRIMRGDEQGKVITDVVIDPDGKHIFYKIGVGEVKTVSYGASPLRGRSALGSLTLGRQGD